MENTNTDIINNKVNDYKDISVSVPGKLFLAGEYAVVNSGQAALLTTVDAFLHLHLKANDGQKGSLSTSQADHVIEWHYNERGTAVSEDVDAENFPLIWEAINTVNLFANELGLFSFENQPVFDIDITSELDAEDGTKYGLGSSGAISVAVVSAVLKAYGLDEHLTESQWVYRVYKLVAITQARLGMIGSLGDVAACTQTGLIYYQNFDREWFDQQEKADGPAIVKLLDNFWPELMIEQLPVNPDWTLSVVWTKEKVSTEELLKLVPDHISDQDLHQILSSFKQYAKRQVLMAKAAIQNNEWQLFKSAIKENYETILKYTQALDKPYLTKTFKKAIKLVIQEHSVAKISGAGAGDCAYAISIHPEEAKEIQQTWQDNDLVVLPFAFWQRTDKEI